jgi:hypothetical protein
MAVQNPIVAAGPTISRAEVKTVAARLSRTVPADADLDFVDGSVVSTPQPAEIEGQMVFVEASDGRSVSMYVVVTVIKGQSDAAPGTEASPGTPSLEWRKITRTGTVTDPRTGKPKDPLFDFYSGLN